MNTLGHKAANILDNSAGSPPAAKTSIVNPSWERPVYFPEWHEILALEPLDALVRARHRTAIIAYLGHCRTAREKASIAGAKRYLDAGALRATLGTIDRDGLRWFFVTYRQRHGSEPANQPWPATSAPPIPMPIPAGTPPWEVKLIRKIRLRGFLWNTEQTYRSWINRFAARFAPSTPDQGTPEQVGEFLTELAVKQVSASTQRQALNALVFYFREVEQRDIGDLGEYRRARRGPRIPVVLSRAEIDRFFAQLHDTWLLMAQLQYGSGLRITELVELRVQSLDLDRHRVLVFGGKGNKDRATVLAKQLVPRLRARLDRLKGLFEQDREKNAPGVWLPRSVERKFPAAGTQWQWQWLFPMAEWSLDPQTGIIRRHHVLDGSFQRVVKTAAQSAGIDKRVTPHVMRHYVERLTMWSSDQYYSENGAPIAA